MRGVLVAALAAVWTLCACAMTTAKSGPAVTTPQLAESAFMTADGMSLPLRRWFPSEAPRAIVVAVHGFNDYSRCFDTVPDAPGVGPFLAQHGIAVLAYDQRGFGASPNHGIWPGRDALVGDFTAVVRAVRAQYPGVPVYGLGESMGGAVIMAAVTSADVPLDGVILSAPAVWARSTMPMIYRVALWIGSRVMPGVKPTGQSLGRLPSDNIAMLRENGRDPLFIKKTRIDSVYGLVGLMDEALVASGKVTLPTLYLYGRNDQIIPPGASAQAMGRLLAANAQARAAFYDSGWHMMLRDKAATTVLGDIAAYIGDRLAPLPSGAEADALARLQGAGKKKPVAAR